MNVEAGQIWRDEEDTYLIVNAPGNTFNALKISNEVSLLGTLSLLFVEAGVEEEVIEEELTFANERLSAVTTEGVFI